MLAVGFVHQSSVGLPRLTSWLANDRAKVL
jgi:hypothetical protein